MRKDYHMHPTVVQHPERFDGFARQAMAKGIEEICVTDHMPLTVSRAGDRIPAGRVEDYCRAVRELAWRYRDRLSIRLGIEVDYHPDYTDEIEAVLRAGQFDFVLGSSHMHVGQCDIFRMVGTYSEYAEASLKNTMMAARSGYFNAIAHLDLYRWVFTLPERFPLRDDGYRADKLERLIEATLEAIRDEGLRLEINPHLAVNSQRLEDTYPEKEIVEKALEKGISFCYGSDAHQEEHVGAWLTELRAHPVYGRALKSWEDEP